MSLLLIDARTHEPFDIVENRQQHYLSDYFTRYSLESRRKVKTVTIDIYSPYFQMIKNSFPNAKIIIDRFHIVQLLNRALNQVRIQEMKKNRYLHPRDYPKLKKETIFELTLKHLDIKYKNTRPYSPWQNGKVKRSHRIDQERFYGRRTFKSVEDLIKKHQCYMNRGNNIARKILNFLNPNQMVENYFTEAA